MNSVFTSVLDKGYQLLKIKNSTMKNMYKRQSTPNTDECVLDPPENLLFITLFYDI